MGLVGNRSKPEVVVFQTEDRLHEEISRISSSISSHEEKTRSFENNIRKLERNLEEETTRRHETETMAAARLQKVNTTFNPPTLSHLL